MPCGRLPTTHTRHRKRSTILILSPRPGRRALQLRSEQRSRRPGTPPDGPRRVSKKSVYNPEQRQRRRVWGSGDGGLLPSGRRFFDYAQNHYGLAKAARGDENAVLPAGWELYTSSVPFPAPRPHGYRLSPVRRCGGCPGYFHRNRSCRLSPAHQGMKIGGAGWELYMSGVPASAPHHGFRLSAVTRRMLSSCRTPMRYPWWGKGGWAHLRLQTRSK